MSNGFVTVPVAPTVILQLDMSITGLPVPVSTPVGLTVIGPPTFVQVPLQVNVPPLPKIIPLLPVPMAVVGLAPSGIVVAELIKN